MKYQQTGPFQKHLEAHPKERFFCLTVPDDFERRRWLRKMGKKVQGFSYNYKSAALEDPLLLSEWQNPSLFDPEPVLVLDEVEKMGKKQLQSLLQELSALSGVGYFFFGARSKTELQTWVDARGVVLDLSEEKSWEKEKRLMATLEFRVAQKGKKISKEALDSLFQKVDKDAALLEQEIDKLICFTGRQRALIEPLDVEKIVTPSKTHTLWQMAEEMIWEKQRRVFSDETQLYALLPLLRSQLQMGKKMAALLHLPTSEIAKRVPKIWPKILEKRIAEVRRFGGAYFERGLEALFQIEILSRSGSLDIALLIDFFLTKLYA